VQAEAPEWPGGVRGAPTGTAGTLDAADDFERTGMGETNAINPGAKHA